MLDHVSTMSQYFATVPYEISTHMHISSLYIGVLVNGHGMHTLSHGLKVFFSNVEFGWKSIFFGNFLRLF